MLMISVFTNLAVIVFLPLISEDRANDGASILYHHLPSVDVPLTEKSTPVNWRSKRITEQEIGLCI